MTTRYDEGDVVRVKNEKFPSYNEKAEITMIENPRSNSPDYEIQFEDGERRWLKASDVEFASEAPAWTKEVKTVTIKKSQLFEQFHRSMLINRSGSLDPLRLQVWPHKDSVKDHYRSKGEFYPDGGPIVSFDWKGLTEEHYEVRGSFEYHLSEQDVVTSVIRHGPKDSEEDVTDRDIKVNFKATNPQQLEFLWNHRKQEVNLQNNPVRHKSSDYKSIEFQWIDDTSAKKFLKRKFDFYDG